MVHGFYHATHIALRANHIALKKKNVQDVVRDFQSCVGRISDHAFNEHSLNGIPTTHYEFPTGYNHNYGLDRYRVPEAYFDPANFSPIAGLSGHAALISESIKGCDIDAQQVSKNLTKPHFNCHEAILT